jgi:hypothetical protein
MTITNTKLLEKLPGAGLADTLLSIATFSRDADVAGGKAVRVKDLLWKINTFGK